MIHSLSGNDLSSAKNSITDELTNKPKSSDLNPFDSSFASENPQRFSTFLKRINSSSEHSTYSNQSSSSNPKASSASNISSPEKNKIDSNTTRYSDEDSKPNGLEEQNQITYSNSPQKNSENANTDIDDTVIENNLSETNDYKKNEFSEEQAIEQKNLNIDFSDFNLLYNVNPAIPNFIQLLINQSPENSASLPSLNETNTEQSSQNNFIINTNNLSLVSSQPNAFLSQQSESVPLVSESDTLETSKNNNLISSNDPLLNYSGNIELDNNVINKNNFDHLSFATLNTMAKENSFIDDHSEIIDTNISLINEHYPENSLMTTNQLKEPVITSEIAKSETDKIPLNFLHIDIEPTTINSLTNPNSLQFNQQSNIPANQISNTLQLSTPFSHPNWTKDFSNQIVWFANQGIQSAQIMLSPPEMGTIIAKLDIVNKQASLQFIASDPSVQQTLTTTTTQLQHLFKEQHLTLVNVNVQQDTNSSFSQQHDHTKSFSENNQNSNFSNSSNFSEHFSNQGNNENHSPHIESLLSQDNINETEQQTNIITKIKGLIDTYV